METIKNKLLEYKKDVLNELEQNNEQLNCILNIKIPTDANENIKHNCFLKTEIDKYIQKKIDYECIIKRINLIMESLDEPIQNETIKTPFDYFKFTNELNEVIRNINLDSKYKVDDSFTPKIYLHYAGMLNSELIDKFEKVIELTLKHFKISCTLVTPNKHINTNCQIPFFSYEVPNFNSFNFDEKPINEKHKPFNPLPKYR